MQKIENIISEVFKEYSILFDGTYREECPKEVTWKDQYKLPYIAPTIELEYEFPFCHLYVRMNDKFEGIENVVSADAQFYKYPKRKLFEQRMDELYLETIARLEKAKEQVMQNTIILEKYQRLSSIDVSKNSSFRRFVEIQVDVTKESNYLPSLEKQIKERFGISDSYGDKDKKTLYLKDGVEIIFDKIFPGSPIGEEIVINCPVLYKKEDFEKIKNFIMKNESVKEGDPRIDFTNYHFFGNKWKISFLKEGDYILNRTGYPILEEMFRKDIEILEKKALKELKE